MVSPPTADTWGGSPPAPFATLLSVGRHIHLYNVANKRWQKWCVYKVSINELKKTKQSHYVGHLLK